MDHPRTLQLVGPTGTIRERTVGGGPPFTSAGISDEELTALALAADPTAPLDEDAVPMDIYLAGRPGPLPDWYMPPAATRACRWRWPIVVPLVVAFLLAAVCGLCVTYGCLSPG